MSSLRPLLRPPHRSSSLLRRSQPLRWNSTRPAPDPTANPFHIPRPPPDAFPPISQRLKPLLPFFLYWTALTSLAFHLLRTRTESKEEMERKEAQISVLEGLLGRLRAQEDVGEEEVQRELEMVGLRERRGPITEEELALSEAGRVGWKEVLLGRKKVKRSEEEQEELANEEWRAVVHTATEHLRPPPTTSPKPQTQVERPTEAKRAPSAAAYNM